MNYYNENDPKAATWLRCLIAGGHIPPGDVDERSILDVRPHEISGYLQQHFFAGIGGWPLALRLAGWPDSRPVRTGSCPCQPFSQAGKRKGEKDERHLWPVFRDLITFSEAAVTFGEQVASKDGRAWLAGVRADMEALGYAFGAADLCAAGVGSPHIRQRLFWVAEPNGQRPRVNAKALSARQSESRGNCSDGGLVLADGAGRDAGGAAAATAGHGRAAESAGGAGGVGDAAGDEQRREREPIAGGGRDEPAGGSGAWSDFDLIPCGDGKARRVESSSLTVDNGIPALMGIDRKEGYGKMEEEIETYAKAQKTRPGEALSLLWLSLVEETIRSGFGGQIGFSSPPVLLSFLRELSNEGWKFSESILRASSQTQEAIMRSLWWKKITSRPSYQRGLEGQHAGESSNPLRVLSSILARHIQAHWGEAVFAYADHGFPLVVGIPGRVGLLRGYGNAIVPQVAAEFIKACLESLT